MVDFDIRQKDGIVLKKHALQESKLQLANFMFIDAVYFFELKKENQTEFIKEFVIGTDLIIDAVLKKIQIKFDGSLGVGTYKGILKSNSKKPKYFLNIPIKIEVYE